MIKSAFLGVLILGGIWFSCGSQIQRQWHLHRLNTELKDVYSHSKYYEKMQRHGLEVSAQKWNDLHEKANEIKAEIQFIKNIETF